MCCLLFKKKRLIFLSNDKIHNRINEILNDMCSIKVFSFSKEKQPWINHELLNQIANRDDALRRARRTGTSDDWVYAMKMRNKTKILINRAKMDYYTDQLDDNKDEPRKYWQHIFTVLNKNRTNNKLNLENDDGNVLDQSA